MHTPPPGARTDEAESAEYTQTLADVDKFQSTRGSIYCGARESIINFANSQ
jgi:hypothetical protein